MNPLRHEMIFASAGAGKTFALTTRYIRLLALGAAPERIVALTFTRKAAGEFFGEILNRLAAASTEERAARALAGAVGQPELGVGDFRRLLRTMIAAMPRLRLGTLDGFFASLVRAFPLELGLGGEPALLEEHAAAEERRRVLGRLFLARGGLTAEQRDLIEAFRQATFGTESKSVAESFDRFVAEHLALHRAAPEPAKWGGAARIWPDGFPWTAVDDALGTTRAAEALERWAAESPILKDKPRARWRAFAREAVAWVPGQPWPADLDFVVGKALAAWPEVEAGAVVLTIDRQKLELGPEVCTPLAVLVRRIVGLELGRRLVITQGIAKVMHGFDVLYDAQVRRAGRLTFADLQQVLAAAGGAPAGTALAYRMDARLDHWLFDEFQDTSHQQWKILEPFVDEVVQDPEGRRSLFYVGDVKQAIFTWREGDPRLFAQVARRYRGGPGGGIVAGELNESWRSGPAVIECVNRVCGAATVLTELLPEAAAEWNANWREHHTAWPEREGQAALLLADDEAGRWATTLRLLQELRPTERGLTCAVLVRKNDVGARLADFLRREGGLAAVAEADLRVGTDNPAATALGALLQSAAHPEDGEARRIVAMSPLAGLLAAGAGDGVPSADRLSRRVLAAVETDGFEAWFATWARRLEAVLAPEDAFSRLRLRQLIAAGRAYDETGGREVDAFLRFLAEYTVREPEGAGVVRVLTVHKSKGLGFDVVLLPDLEGRTLAQRRSGPAVRKAADRAIDWVLQHPGATIADADPVLREYQREALAENCYEQLSLLYVALTRAKRALYVVIERPGKTTSANYPVLLTRTLGAAERPIAVGAGEFVGVWSAGSGDWIRAVATPRGPAPAAGAAVASGPRDAGVSLPPVPAAAAQRALLVARRPSGLKPARVSAERLFGGTTAAVDFGTRVHALLAAVDWADGAAARELAAPEAEAHGVADEAVREAAACVHAPELKAVFARENPGDEVWRERAFEAVVEGAWVSGVLDRVVRRRRPDGTREVAVFDFKTERDASVGELRTRHAAQLELYRTVVARLAGVPAAAVRCFVVATAARRLVEIGAERA